MSQSQKQTLNIKRVSVTVMTFKAYVTAVMNKLTYVLCHKVG